MVVHSAGIDGTVLSVTGKLRQALSEQAQQLSLETIWPSGCVGFG